MSKRGSLAEAIEKLIRQGGVKENIIAPDRGILQEDENNFKTSHQKGRNRNTIVFIDELLGKLPQHATGKRTSVF